MNQYEQHDAADGDNVVYLPAAHDDGSEEVLTGEVVRVDERAPGAGAARETFNTRLVSEAARERMAGGAVVLARRAGPVATVGTKAAVRHALYPAYGVRAVVRRYRDAHGGARFERQMRAAEARGDQEALRYWHETATTERQRRHERAMDWLDSPMKLVKAIAWGLGGFALLLLVLGVALAIGGEDFALLIAPIGGVIEAIKWAWWFATAYGALVLLSGTGLGVAYLWNEGRKQDDAIPTWAQPASAAAGAGPEVVNVTPSIVVTALRDLGISALRKAIKDDPDSGAWMLGPITRRGHGAEVAITLPSQLTVHHVMTARATLAGNLDRKAHEVFIESSADSERKFTLWIADSGALDYPVPPSPLMDEHYGPVDLYRDAMPWGVTAQGDPIELNLLQQHFLLVGLSKQGKTAAARSLALWVALDPSVRIWLADLKGFGDWSMFEGLAEQLIEGAGDDNFIATCDLLESAVVEMQRRYEAWRALGKKGDIDRAHSQPGSGFEPLVVIVDEVQKLYTCPTEHPDGGDIGGNGKRARAARAAQALHDQARAVNIHLWQFAQNPTDKNVPAVVREGAMIRGSLFVGTESIAKMGLGEAAVDTGAAPHALRNGLDRGTVVLAPGESMDLPGGANHTTVRTHYIGTQDAHTIAERAKALRADHQAPVEVEQRDLLADVATVLRGQDKARATDVCTRLRDLASHHPPYKALTAEGLRDQLAACGVRVTKVGVLMVYADRVHAALAAREGPSTHDPAGTPPTDP